MKGELGPKGPLSATCGPNGLPYRALKNPGYWPE